MIDEIDLAGIRWDREYYLEHPDVSEPRSEQLILTFGSEIRSTTINIVPVGYLDPKQMGPQDAVEFWRTRNDAELYLIGRAWRRSELLVTLFRDLSVPETSTITEIGCGIGRNLIALYQAGYHNLRGYDIVLPACPLQIIDLISRDLIDPTHPIIAASDVCYTMATLQHVHPTYRQAYYDAMAGSKLIITIEDERSMGLCAYPPRNLVECFEHRGYRQSHTEILTDDYDLANYTLRIFQRCES